MILLRWLYLLFLPIFSQLAVAEDYKISKTKFDHGSNRITYFDDSPNILNINDKKLYISRDNGVSWDDITSTLTNGDTNIHITGVFYDHNYKERAFITSNSNKFWFTTDKGKAWKSFEIDFEWNPVTGTQFTTNVNSRNNVIITITQCENFLSCHRNHYFTNDEFNSDVKKIEGNDVISCIFTTTKFLPENVDNILCTTNVYDGAGRAKYTTVFSSNDWFKSKKEIKGMDDAFVYEIEVVNSFIIVKCLADKFSREAYVNLYVSKDGYNFQKAHFPGDLKSEAFTILPSTDNSLHVSVWGMKKTIDGDFSRGISELYASDFNGVTFKKLDKLSEKEDFYGFYSVEKISNLDGVWLGNILKASSASSGFLSFFPDINSMMSFDDGRSWIPLEYEIDPTSDVKSYCTSSDNCRLNLLNAIEMDGDGNFESGPSAGILLGLGMVSNSLAIDYDKLSTWISRDGGYSWKVALNKPCVFSIGDQGNIIVAIPDVMNLNKGAVDRSLFYYSVDQGLTWQEGHVDQDIFPMILTTTIDGSSQKFIFSGFDIEGVEDLHNMDLTQLKYNIYALDFSDLFNGKVCSSGDMEEFVARKSKDSDSGICIMGHTEKFQRRKQDSKCFVNKLYEDIKPIEESCPCDKVDYECSEGFYYENGECSVDLSYFRQLCLDKNNNIDKKKIAKLDRIPGNTCKDSSFKLDENNDYYTVDCKSILEDNRSFNIKTEKNEIPGSLLQYVYMDQSSVNFKDESIIVLNNDRKVFMSHDGGMHFFYANFRSDNVVGILADNYDGNHVILLGEGKYYFETSNRAQSFYKKPLPAIVNIFGYVPLYFHPTDTNKYIFIGSTDACATQDLQGCNTAAYLTTDGGASWNKLLEGARSCDFSGSRFKLADDSLIICEQRNLDNSVRIVSSKQMFMDPSEIKVHFERTVGMAPDDGFIVVAAITGEDNSLSSLTTIDGETWAHAKYPYDFSVGQEQAYTVLKSNSKTIYLHVTTSTERGKEYGSILKSNSNGTSYVLSENFVNRNTVGFVDFEKVDGVEGISLINVVDNVKEVKNSDVAKKVKTKITHNDAAEWSYLNPPPIDSDGKKYDCVSSNQPVGKCSLNLHGFTERKDFRDTYSSGSALGLMIGNGNVGPYLDSDISKAGTFLTRDGGITWREISKQPLAWEFGDQGGIIVLVDQINPTKEVKFSVDQGNTWGVYTFIENEVRVMDIATIPSDTSRKFVIFATSSNDAGKFLAIGVDFHGVFKRQCNVDFDKLDGVSKSDYEYWTPKHPFLADNCLFGREARFLRRKPESSDCFIGNSPLGDAYKVIRNCSCTRRDYECDYNFAKTLDGTCKLVEGLSPKDPKEVCINKNIVEYFEPTGYRKIPLSSCVGGKELEKYEPHACPGKQSEFNREHGSGITTGSNFFFVLLIPFSAFCFSLWFFYDRGIRRNGGFARLGAIRLEGGEGETYGFPTRIENNATDKIVNKVVDVGVMVFMAGFTALNYIRKVIAGRRNPLGGGHYSSLTQNQVFLDDDEILGNEDESYNDGNENDDLFNIDDSENDAFDDDAASLTSDAIGA